MIKKIQQTISVVIPVYNGGKTLQELIRRLNEVLSKCCPSFEFILVDDASQDHSWSVINSLSAEYNAIKGVQLMKNSGQANATLCGLGYCSNEIIITMDDDLQHIPEQIPLLIEPMISDPDIDCVFGIFKEKKHSLYRNIGSSLKSRLQKITFGLARDVKTSGFRVLRKHLARQLCQINTMNPSLAVLILNCTRNVLSVPVVHGNRCFGKSNYTVAKQLRLAFDNICSSSVLPLRIITFMGIGLCAVSLFMVVYFFIRYLFGYIGVQGWTTLVILISFYSGILLLSMGIFGEYLVRVLREVSHAPPYMVRRTTDSD